MTFGAAAGQKCMTTPLAGTSQVSTLGDMAVNESVGTPTSVSDLGLLILRLGVGAAVLQAGLIKAFDFGTTVGFMDSGGWQLPAFAALMVTVAEAAGAIGVVLGVLTPLAACAIAGAMVCAWAVNVSTDAFWAQPFNVPFLLFVGAATLLFTGAGAYSVDARMFGRPRWSPRLAIGLLVLAFAAAILTWLLLNGTNPLHFSSPA